MRTLTSPCLRLCFLVAAYSVLTVSLTVAMAQDKPADPKEKVVKSKKAVPQSPQPTMANVAYGEHPRNVLDFWKADSKTPTPLLFYIHGGGWMAGDKSRVDSLAKYLDSGISVVSINYRFVSQAYDAGVRPPVKAPLHDAARALQFVRSKASEWNIDPTRIGASGGSAGACSSLWLAFHDDMAQPESADPIARESTRLMCAAVNGAQTTLDPAQMREWTPNSRYGSHAFGIFKVDAPKPYTQDFDAFVAKRGEITEWINEYSPYALVTSDDSPVYLFYTAPPALGQDQKDPTHTSNFGVKLQARLNEVGVPCELVYPGAADVSHQTASDYLIDQLSVKAK